MKYFGNRVTIEICGKNFNIDDEMMKLITDNVVYCTDLWFVDCKFNGPYLKTKQPEHYSKLESLRLRHCEFSNGSFEMFSQWAVLSKSVKFWDCKGINCEMWEIFGGEIDDTRHKGLKLKELSLIGAAFDESSWAGAVRVFVKSESILIRNCGICEEWWTILANEVKKRANEGTLTLKTLDIGKNSGIYENIRQSLEYFGVEVDLRPEENPPPSPDVPPPSVSFETEPQLAAQSQSSASVPGPSTARGKRETEGCCNVL